jgi:hypothetical protein
MCNLRTGRQTSQRKMTFGVLIQKLFKMDTVQVLKRRKRRRRKMARRSGKGELLSQLYASMPFVHIENWKTTNLVGLVND